MVRYRFKRFELHDYFSCLKATDVTSVLSYSACSKPFYLNRFINKYNPHHKVQR